MEFFLFCAQELEEKYPSIEFIAINGEEDHIHIQIIISPDLTVSETVQKIKSYSSQKIRKKFKFIDKIYMNKEGIWSVGYFSSTI